MRTAQFLDSVYRDCEGGVVELRATPSGRCTRTPIGTWTPLGPAVSQAVNARQDVRFGLATRRDDSNGTAANLRELPMLVVDLDVLPADARARLRGFAFRLALLVASGLHVQGYLRLREPHDMTAPDAVARVASVQRRLAAYLGADDRCTSPAVAPRLINTYNWKYGDPRPVTLLDETDATVNLCELEEFLPAEVVRRNCMTIQSSIPVSQRNDQLYALARSLRARGVAFAAIDAAVHSVNATCCEEPLDDAEIRRLLHYALLAPHAPGFVVHPPRPTVVHHGRLR